jgi:hypothetical protein
MQTANEQNPSIDAFRPTTSLSRRRFGLLLVAATGAFAVPIGRAAIALTQEATPTPAARSAELGYPELRLVATDDGFEAPEQVATGRYLIVLENRGTPGGPAQVSDANFIQLPPGAAIEELNALLLAENAAIPEWYGEIVSSGGFYVEAGQTGYAILDLEPGDWYVGVGDTNPFVPMTVTEPAFTAPSVPIADPAADVTVDYREFALDLPDRLPAGTLVWHATNRGEQMHAVTFARTPELLTVAQVQTLLSLAPDATPPPGVPDMSTIEVLTSELKNLSPGRQIWVELDLAPGFYAAICALPDSATGQPHAMLGEIAVFTVV